MKSAPALMLALIVSATLASAGEPAAIPFDAKKAKAINDSRRAVTAALTLEAYQKVGQRNAKWDRTVEQALKLFVEHRHGLEWDRAVAQTKLRELLATAIESGCDDPLVRYLHLAMPNRRFELNAERKEKFHEAVKAFALSNYPDLTKAQAWQDALDEWLRVAPGEDVREDDHKAAVGCLDELLKLLAKLCRGSKPSERHELLGLCFQVCESGHIVAERKKWFERLDAEVFAKLDKDDPLPHVVAGMFHVKHAWDARGGGVAITVTEEGWRLLKERLKEAEKRLTKAWELDNTCADVAAEMVTVCMGLGHERATMEKWFQRAIAAEPAHRGAFQRKMTYLLPKWHGTREDTLEFARQAVRSDRWESGHPLTLLFAHMELAVYSREPSTYFSKRTEVWSDVEAIIDEIRRRFPKSPLGATIYLYFASLSNKNATEANEYVKAVEDTGADLVAGALISRVQIAEAMAWMKRSIEKEEK